MLIFLKMNLAIISLVGNGLRMEVSMSDVVNNVIPLFVKSFPMKSL